MGFISMIFGGADGAREFTRAMYDRQSQYRMHEGAKEAHVAALCITLESCYKARRRSISDVQLFGEVAPFMAMTPPDARNALAEYVIYTKTPELADKQYLGSTISSTIASIHDNDVLMLVYNGFIFKSPWVELLDHSTFDVLTKEVMSLSGIDFAEPSETKQAPTRGEDVTATASVPLETAALGGYARVFLPTGRAFDVTIVAGVEEGDQLRLSGQGQPGRFGGEPGDAVITIKISLHPIFQVSGRDLKLELPVTPDEATLGCRIAAPTLEGQVDLLIPPGSNGGRVLRLSGKGLPALKGKFAGNLYITLMIAPSAPSMLARVWRCQ